VYGRLAYRLGPGSRLASLRAARHRLTAGRERD
jgi:hypothetical protein